MLANFLTAIISGVMGILVLFALEIIGGIAFYFVYNPLASKWLYFIPTQFQSVGFWESIGLFILIGLFGNLIKKLSPFTK